jgi:hypothetical protein
LTPETEAVLHEVTGCERCYKGLGVNRWLAS